MILAYDEPMTFGDNMYVLFWQLLVPAAIVVGGIYALGVIYVLGKMAIDKFNRWYAEDIYRDGKWPPGS